MNSGLVLVGTIGAGGDGGARRDRRPGERRGPRPGRHARARRAAARHRGHAAACSSAPPTGLRAARHDLPLKGKPAPIAVYGLRAPAAVTLPGRPARRRGGACPPSRDRSAAGSGAAGRRRTRTRRAAAAGARRRGGGRAGGGPGRDRGRRPAARLPPGRERAPSTSTRSSSTRPRCASCKAAGVKLAVPLVSQGELIGVLNLGPAAVRAGLLLRRPQAARQPRRAGGARAAGRPARARAGGRGRARGSASSRSSRSPG